MDLAPMLGQVRDLGEFIRDQRTAAHLSLRGLAAKAGISNPYLSQVERGLRKPSAEILTQIAHGLSISAESLLTRAGVLPERPADETAVIAAIRADPVLTAGQQAALVEIYRSFRGSDTEPADTEPSTTEFSDTEHETGTPVTEGD